MDEGLTTNEAVIDQKFKELNDRIRNTDKLLRRLEKTSKILTQHVQTSIFTYSYQFNRD